MTRLSLRGIVINNSCDEYPAYKIAYCHHNAGATRPDM